MSKNSPVDLASYTAGAYNPGSALKRIVWYFLSFIFFETLVPFPSYMKVFILRIMGANVGKEVVVKPCVKIKYPWFLTIGDYVWVGERAWIDNLAPVRLGGHSCISQEAYLLTGNHDYKDPLFALKTGGIDIGAGAWIGAKAIVCPGLTVGDGAILCAGSVAVCELEKMKIYQGNPAKYIRDREIRKN